MAHLVGVMQTGLMLWFYGPPGIKAMTDHVFAAWADDIKIRNGPIERDLPEHGADGYRVNAHEISPGVVYRDDNVTGTAFNVNHGEWGMRAFGYRFQTADRSIVITGDTSPSDTVVEQCNGCDVLIHEVYTEAGYAKASPEWKRMRRASHDIARARHVSPIVAWERAASALLASSAPH